VPIYSGLIADYSSEPDFEALPPGKGRCYRMSFYLDDDLGGPSVDDNSYQGSSVTYSIGVSATQVH
jgi:hypothetical protein